MNYLLSVLLLLAILLFAFAVYRIERSRAMVEASTRQPENLRFILKDMLRTVEAEGQWTQLERMRDEVRRALWTLDSIRHDPSNAALRTSKQRLEAQSNPASSLQS